MQFSLPSDVKSLCQWDWSKFEPQYKDLAKVSLTPGNVEQWLADWSRVAEAVDELYNRFYVAHTVDTVDKDADEGFNNYMSIIYPAAQAADQVLKEKLLASKLTPAGFEIPLRALRAKAEIFRQENLGLLGDEQKQWSKYEAIMGAQSVTWEGKETTVSQLRLAYQDADRSKRESAWRLGAERQFADYAAINESWQKLMAMRQEIARNADLPSFREYRWKFLMRFDYTPEDSKRFQDAIEKAVVPVAKRLYERRRKMLGIDRLRPWDLDVDPLQRPPLRPFKNAVELQEGAACMFHAVDPTLGAHLDEMIRGNMLDLENRKNKAPGAYCTIFATIRKPFIFHNAVGVHDDLQTMLHEGGHAMHVFEFAHLPYFLQLDPPMEFCEVASMAMELLASPYLEQDKGGFYNKKDAAQALAEHLERCILFWPYMAVVDAFQHWVYENVAEAMQPANCDAAWSRLWDRFMAGVDWSGMEDFKKSGWHRKPHIHSVPMYYIEYGLAQLGAVQIWARAMQDQKQAVTDYRRALSLGATAALPDLYKTAGARLAFDAETLGSMVALMENKIGELDKI
jgi:oligoendopeptidase F